VLSRLAYNARIYGKLQLVHLRAHLEYEADFWIGIVGVVLTHGAGFVFVWAFFSSVPSIAGWGLWDTAFLYALSIIPRGLVEILCDGQWNLRMLVNRGEFDRLLVRPISPALVRQCDPWRDNPTACGPAAWPGLERLALLFLTGDAAQLGRAD